MTRRSLGFTASELAEQLWQPMILRYLRDCLSAMAGGNQKRPKMATSRSPWKTDSESPKAWACSYVGYVHVVRLDILWAIAYHPSLLL